MVRFPPDRDPVTVIAVGVVIETSNQVVPRGPLSTRRIPFTVKLRVPAELEIDWPPLTVVPS